MLLDRHKSQQNEFKKQAVAHRDPEKIDDQRHTLSAQGKDRVGQGCFPAQER